nr:KIRREL [Halicryptus spinulosus]
MEYQWYRNGELLFEEKGHKLTIFNIDRSYQNSEVKCEARNTVGMSDATYTIEMAYGPKFLSPPASVAVNLGEDATLQCESDGNPRPTIVWLRNNNVAGPRVLSTTPTLNIQQVSQQTAGRYICRAAVPNFPDVAAEVVIYIKGPPKIVSSSIQKAQEGSNAEMICQIEGMPLPKVVIWSRHGKALDPADDRYTIISEEYTNVHVNKLIISNIHGSDFGAYNCTVDNGYGIDEKTIVVEKTLPLPIMIGSIIGALILIVIIAIVIVLCNRRKHVEEESTYESKDNTRGRSNMVALSDYKPGSTLRSNAGSIYRGDIWPPDGRDSVYRVSGEYAEPATLMQKPDNRINNNGFLHIDDYVHDYGSSQNYVRQPSYRLSNNSLPQPSYLLAAPHSDYRNYDNYAAPRAAAYVAPPHDPREEYVEESLNPNRLSTRV